MEISDFEKKRASNLIWNAAHDYSIDTGFRVYDREGHADIYWNTISGIIHRRYDWERLMEYYNSFSGKLGQNVYESLFWIALENGAFLKEKDVRPALAALREAYASGALVDSRGVIDEDHSGQRLVAVTRGHLRHCLGEDAGLPDEVDRKLLDAIELPAELDTEGAIGRIDGALTTYFPYMTGTRKLGLSDRIFAAISSPIALIRRQISPNQADGAIKSLSFGYGEKSDGGGAAIDQSSLSVRGAKYTAQSDTGLKAYITDYFGTSIYDDRRLGQLSRKYCTGDHTDVKLHITRGDYTEEMLSSGFAGKMHRQALRQAKINEEKYHSAEQVNRVQIDKLCEKIRNSLLVRTQDAEIRARSGRIDTRKAWRALYLDDERVFKKTLPGESGNISVDILLDASTSQVHRQEIVSAQGYMIAEALTRCDIPVRVSSFCSITGYTVLTIFRDYSERDKNREIFKYFTTGANRDGLAVRLACALMSDQGIAPLEENHSDTRILILLSDCTPNDMIKMRGPDGAYLDYAAAAGVENTATEVHLARMKDIQLLCIFTGEDRSLPDVHRIYGHDFTRIRRLDMFAEAVGAMLADRIEG